MAAMKLVELLGEDGVAMDLKANDKFEAIERMVDLLLVRGKLKKERKKAVLDALVARERVASTGLENGIALPHATVGALEDAVAALGVSPAGINFQCQDGKPAHLIVMLVIPQRLKHEHVRTLPDTARLLNYEEIRRSLLNARTARQVVQILREEAAKEFV